MFVYNIGIMVVLHLFLLLLYLYISYNDDDNKIQAMNIIEKIIEETRYICLVYLTCGIQRVSEPFVPSLNIVSNYLHTEYPPVKLTKCNQILSKETRLQT